MERNILNKIVPGIMSLAVLLSACGDDDGGFNPSEGRFAVIRTDFQSTAIGILDGNGALVEPATISSGSVRPRLVAPLSGDVVLANTRTLSNGILNIIDRFGTDVVTRYQFQTGDVIGQVRVSPLDNSFASNPRDMAIVGMSSAWVSRFEPNIANNVSPIDAGNDLVEIDINTFQTTGRRVDLSVFNSTVTVAGTPGPREVLVYARPNLIAASDRVLIVGLALLSFDFDAAAPGRFAAVNVDSLEVVNYALPDATRNCGQVRAVPGAEFVLIACQGYGDPIQTRASAGVYILDIADLRIESGRSWTPGTSSPLAVSNVVPISPTRFVGVAADFVLGDEAFLVDVDSGQMTSLLKTSEGFTIGIPAYDVETGILLVPDSSSTGAGVHQFRSNENGVFSFESKVTFEDGPLPPTAIYRL